MTTRRLLFVSPRFLFPADSGGKIRTTQVLKGMKGRSFKIELAMPGRETQRLAYKSELESVADTVALWESPSSDDAISWLRRLVKLTSEKPLSVAADYSVAGANCVARALNSRPDVVVFDFPHSAVLAPDRIDTPSVMFTHNVESEILKRHVEVAGSRTMRMIWKNQYEKMLRFEEATLVRFDNVVAVSERDRRYFRSTWNLSNCELIPTGVDTDFFGWQAPESSSQVVFCGSMDWLANIDAVNFFHDKVWQRVRRRMPKAKMKVVGRSPPQSLVSQIRAKSPEWEFTGFVDDIRRHVAGAAVFVIPLRVGSGTRIKAYEAMAMGTPVVSTSIGVEGLPVVDGDHCLVADDPDRMADLVVDLLSSRDARIKIARCARELVESRFGFLNTARAFEGICLNAIRKRELRPADREASH